MWQPPGHPGLAWQHLQELTWGQEDAGPGLGGVGQLAEPLRVSVLDVLRPEPGDREGSGQRGAVGRCGAQVDGEGVQHLLGVRWGVQAGLAAGTPAPGTEGVPRQHALAAAAVQAAVGEGHLSHRRVGGCIDQALWEGAQWGQRAAPAPEPCSRVGPCTALPSRAPWPPANEQDLPNAD